MKWFATSASGRPPSTNPALPRPPAPIAARVEGQTVSLVPDLTDRDALGRLLRYVYLPDGTFVNAQQIADGWAQPAITAPDTSQAATFERVALEAAKARRGFWGGSFTGSDLAAYALTLVKAPLYSAPGANNGIDALLAIDTPLTALGRSLDGAWVRVPHAARWMKAGFLHRNCPSTSRSARCLR